MNAKPSFSYSVQEILPSQTLSLRQQILRPMSAIKECCYAEDHHPSCFHLGALKSDNLVIGTATFFRQPPKGDITKLVKNTSDQASHLVADLSQEQFMDHKGLSEKSTTQLAYWRLRGMAAAFEHQGQGLGSALLSTGIKKIRQLNGDVLWCNARESAIQFYQKHGFELEGAIFDIDGIGPHCIMYRYL